MRLPHELRHPLTVTVVSPSRWVVYGHPSYPLGLMCPDLPNHKDPFINRLVLFDSADEVREEVEFYRSLTVIPYTDHPEDIRVVGGRKIYVGEDVTPGRIRAEVDKIRRPKSKHRVTRSRSQKYKFTVSHGHRYGGPLRVGCDRDLTNATDILKPLIPALRECSDVRDAQRILDQGVPQ
jgi:hypothetical protein